MPPTRSRIAHRLLAATLVLTLLGGGMTASAADSPAPRAPGSPPRIGLALSGGGARGIAHVGVLKVLDEMHIPISCVTGTSMGAIVAGTYAVGTPPKRLEELVLAADWAEIFRDNPPRQDLAIRRKEDDFKTLFAPEFGVKDGGLALPKGVIAGVSIEAFFRVLAQPAVGITDFSKLPIPFEAMATDIENGDSVVLNRGSVAQAMRASMSVPGAIAPVEIEGRLLVDGGIANNLPINQARKLCADVIIAVNISTPPLQRKDLTSALAVALQLVNFLGKSTVDEQLKSMGPNDVLIEPDLGDISAASFARSKDAIRIGEEATRKLADKLSRYSIAPDKYAEFRAKQVADKATLGTVAEIRFEGLERTNPDVLRGMLDTKPGEALSEETVNADLRRIYGRGDFEGVSYRVIGDTGPRTMVVTPREKLWGPDYLRFGLGLATDFQGENQFNVLAQYRKTWLNSLGAEWLTEAQIGADTHLFTEWYQPLNNKGVWFASLYGVVGQTTRGIFNNSVSDPQQIADYLISSARAGVDLGATLGTWGALRFGPQWTQVHARVDVGDPVLPSVSQLTAGGRVNLVIDQLNHPWFPESGYGMTLNYYGATTALGSAINYQRLVASGTYVASWGENTINLFASGGSDFNTDMPAYEAFALGGPLRLSAYRLNQFNGHEFAFGRAMFYRRILPLPDLLGSGVYIGASAEVGQIRDRFDRLPSPGTLYSGSVFLGANTFAGPAYLGAGFGTGNAFSVYLLLGAP